MGGRLAGIWRQQPHFLGSDRIEAQNQEAQIRAVSEASTAVRCSEGQFFSVYLVRTLPHCKTRPHLECVSIQTLRKARKRLEAGAGVRDECDSRDGARVLSCCNFDALSFARLVLEGACEVVSMSMRGCCAIRPHQKRALRDPWSAAAMTGEQHAEPAGRWQCARTSSKSAPDAVEGVWEQQWGMGGERGRP